jgi:hypothetical protein
MTDRIKVTIYKDGQLLARHNSKQFTDAQELLAHLIDTMNTATTMVELNRIHNMYLGGLRMLQQVSLMDAEERFDWMEAEYKDYFRNVQRIRSKEGREV